MKFLGQRKLAGKWWQGLILSTPARSPKDTRSREHFLWRSQEAARSKRRNGRVGMLRQMEFYTILQSLPGPARLENSQMTSACSRAANTDGWPQGPEGETCVDWQRREDLSSKWLPVTRSRSPNTSAHYILVLELPKKKKNNTVRHWERKCYVAKRQSKISFHSGHQSAMASRAFPTAHTKP